MVIKKYFINPYHYRKGLFIFITLILLNSCKLFYTPLEYDVKVCYKQFSDGMNRIRYADILNTSSFGDEVTEIPKVLSYIEIVD